jgi:hypothetical protein
MTAVTLTPTEPRVHMARFYVLDVQPDLLRRMVLHPGMGPHRTASQLRHVPKDEAKEALARQRRAKECRGCRTAPYLVPSSIRRLSRWYLWVIYAESIVFATQFSHRF